ncbi:signal peptidase I [Paenarthrobacter sp. NPDC090520]|uniref:signal peptidase I n=1 Tax=Paenarthrobacter sp. NPDC090520 TaxID=3364382 RepID=UPI0038074D8C
MTTETSLPARRRRLFRSPWVHAILALLLVALVQGFFVKIYQVPSGSMEQTLNIGDRVVVNRLAPEPQRGDVVIFRQPASWGPAPERGVLRSAVGWFGELTGIGPSNTEYLVKRVIGLPGDTVECCDASGRLKVNGDAIDEPYVFQDFAFDAGTLDCSTAVASPRCFATIRLGQDQYLVLGDHRSQSADSLAACRGLAAAEECVRTVRREDITGRVEWFLFPFDKWSRNGSLSSSSSR